LGVGVSFLKKEGGQPLEIEKGLRCTDTNDIVDRPRQCPCPVYEMVKCELDDWYVCIAAGGKCVEGQYAQYGGADEGEIEDTNARVSRNSIHTCLLKFGVHIT